MKKMNKIHFLFFIGAFALFFALSAPVQAQSTDPNFKVAFIGDSAAGSDFQAVLNLIKQQQTQLVLHQGDMDYSDGPQVWMNMVNTTLGASFPYFASDGNHDEWVPDGYSAFIKDRLQKTGVATPPAGDLPSNYSIVYKGLKMVFTQEGGNPAFIQQELANDPHTWKVCSWHKNQASMQVGGKGDEQGWGDYENCLQAGAIVATGHEHSYERTKTMTSFQNHVVDSNCSNPTSLCVAKGKTFAFVSGIGGNSLRTQSRCLTATTSGECSQWASIYTTNQSAGGPTTGVLFITFNVDGNPSKARGQMILTNNTVKDSFDILAASGSSVPTATPITTPGGLTSTPIPTTPPSHPTSTPSGPSLTPNPTCAKKTQGDADCDGQIKLADYDRWRQEFYGEISTKTADFNGDGHISLVDHSMWRQTYFDTNSGTLPTPTPGGNPTATPGSNPTATLPPGQPTATPGGPTPTNGPPPAAGAGLWISKEEIAARPASGAAWDAMKAAADGSWDPPELYNQDSNHDQQTFAAALVYAKTGIATYRTKAENGIMSIIVTGPVSSGAQDGRSLALGRNLLGYVLSADLINLGQLDAAKDGQFRSFLTKVRTWTNSEGRSLTTCHEQRPNNWGTMCGASRIAADRYLGDKADLDKAWTVFKGYVGDRTAWTGFSYSTDAPSWMCNPSTPRPINPAGCTVQGHVLDGAPVDDVQREGPFTWPPRNSTLYPGGGLGAAVAQAELLYRAGYDAFNIENKAMLRAMQIVSTTFKASNSYTSNQMYWIGNYRYGAVINPTSWPLGYGKPISWTNWTHAK